MAKKRVKERKTIEAQVFLPDCTEQVKAIAMRGLSDKEMAAQFGIPNDLFNKWKKFYPDFKQAIEDGRTKADVKVVKALFDVATGYSHSDTKIHYDSKDQEFYEHQYTKHYKPDLGAIKLWLTNRQKEHWADRQETAATTTVEMGLGLPGMKDETKDQLISSILSLITPKPDGE